MRKILIGVLSVAGLFGVVLALAGPATAAKQTITFFTDGTAVGGTAAAAGTYTLKWETQGGCDPGTGTSGASGTATVTVTRAGTAGTATAPTGAAVSTGVNIDNICQYKYSATFAYADGRKCAVNVTGSGATRNMDVQTNACDKLVKINITFAPFSRTAVAASGNRPAVTAIAAKEPDIGAVKGTTFTITATHGPGTGAFLGGNGINPNTPPNSAPPNTPLGAGCTQSVTGTSKVDSAGVNKATLTVVGSPHTSATSFCSYALEYVVPDGFEARGYRTAAGFENLTAKFTGVTPCVVPAAQNPCGADPADVRGTFLVSVLQRTVFLVQNVTGDADGGRATYNYSATCGAAGGLPPALPVNTGSGGVVRTRGTTSVELREGRFNASLALSPTATDAGLPVYAYDKTGKACNATVAVSGLPAACTADSATKSANLATSGPQAIIEFMITCTPPPPPTTTTAAPPPTTTTEAMDDDMDMDGAGDMDGDDDMNGDMDGDDDGDTGPQAMGDTG